MRRYWKASFLGLALMTMNAMAQTNTNTFPNSGNVGIGTIGPGYLLDIRAASNPILSIGQTGYAVNPISSTQVAGIKLNNQVGNGDKLVDIKAVVYPGQYMPSFVVTTSPTYTTTPADRFTIRESGYIGIGTNVPRTNLDIIGGIEGATSFINLDSGTGNAGTVGIQFLHLDGGGLNQQKAAILSDATGAYGKANLRFALNTANDLSNVSALDTKLYIDGGTGNIGIGTTSPSAKLEIAGNLKLSAGTGASITFPDNTTQATAWTGSLCGGDYAESVDVSGDRKAYEPGDVMVVDPDNPGRFLKASEPYSTLVAGIYSTKPGVIGRRQTSDSATSSTEVPMAMVGIVPTKVNAENGPIRPGDLLVTSSTVGYVMKATDPTRMIGSIVGKSLGNLRSGSGVIEVLVSLQ